MKWLYIKGWVVVLFLTGLALSQDQSRDSLLALDDLVSKVLLRNPSLRAMQHTVASRQAAVSWQGSLPDPVLSLGIMNLPTDTYDLNSDPMAQKVIGLSQEFPFFGKLSLKEQLAEIDHRNQDWEYANLRLALLEQVKKEYFELAYITHALQTTEENLLLLTDFVEIAETKYRVGSGLQQDVLRSEVERLRLEKMILQLIQQKSAAENRINTLLDAPPDSLLGHAELFDLPQPVWTGSEVESLAVKYNPVLAAAELSIEQGRARRDLAAKEYWPNFNVSLTYNQRNNYPDMLSGFISVNLPLYALKKQSSKVEEETLATRAAESAYIQAKNEILSNLKLIQDMIRRDIKMIRLYEDAILPQADLALKSAMAAYKTDRVDFTTLLENQVTLLNHKIDYDQTRRDYAQNIATLERLCATDLMEYKLKQ